MTDKDPTQNLITDKKVTLYCKHGADEECNANCTYAKFAASGYDEGGKGDPQDRIGFVKKVYGILFSMLGCTIVIIGASLNNDALRGCEYGGGANPTPGKWDETCGGDAEDGLIAKLWIPCAVIAIVSLVLLVTVPIGREQNEDGEVTNPGKPLHMSVPYNYALLVVFTLCTSIVYAKISLAAQAGNPGVVFEAFALTCAAVMGITIFAITKFRDIDGVQEISMIGPGLSAIGLVFGVTAFFVFAPNKRLGCDLDADGKCMAPSSMRLLYACLGVILFSMIMLFDTASVIGGKSIMFELGPETYILGAIQLYLEMINMFVLIIVILGEA